MPASSLRPWEIAAKWDAYWVAIHKDLARIADAHGFIWCVHGPSGGAIGMVIKEGDGFNQRARAVIEQHLSPEMIAYVDLPLDEMDEFDRDYPVSYVPMRERGRCGPKGLIQRRMNGVRITCTCGAETCIRDDRAYATLSSATGVVHFQEGEWFDKT